ncbi:hypothetical protein [Dactylosporangium darangshiense]|uniref:Zinc-binding domain-containing protein n=1 Tax=Dactylosporangium darangshiense TaxID=579108 RepID=A0ABP8DNL7_9ACTN
MTLHLNLDHDSRVYFSLTCDRCGLPFACYDDACYEFTSLRDEAVYAGWDAATRPGQPTYCPACVRTDVPATNPEPAVAAVVKDHQHYKRQPEQARTPC